MSDFAKAQLLKYGWTEGKGLGKNENGIAEALKPKLKFDTSGVGHKDLEFEWWDSVYDKALKNIVLDKKSDEVSIKIAKENAFNISSTKSGLESCKKKHSLHYGKFLKTSTLQNGNLIKDSSCQFIEEEPTDIQRIIKMSDEDLFKACGGRTAHKGARHGLTLNGKLARIAEQEKQLIAAGYLKSKVESSDKTETKLKRKKKKKRDMEVEDCTTKAGVKNEIIAEVEEDCVVSSKIQSDDDYKPSKKTCKKVKRKIHNLSLQLTKSCMIEDDTISNEQDVSKEKKSRKECKNKKKKSKRKRDPNTTDNDMNDIQLDDDTTMEPSAKKLKKSRNALETSSSTVEETDQSLYRTLSDDRIEPMKIRSKCKKGSHRPKDHKVCSFTKIEAERLNHKIQLKKNRAFKRKEKKTYGKLLESLLAVSLDTNPAEEIVINKSKPSKISHKKNKTK